MTPNEYEVLTAAAAGGRSKSWFEDPERIAATRDLVARGYIKLVDLHLVNLIDTSVEPTHYRTTLKGQDMWDRVPTWKAARLISLS
jgi:hypothetical protein